VGACLIEALFVKLMKSFSRIGDENAVFGSLGVITGKPMRGKWALHDWLEEGVESTLRDTEDDVPVPTMLAIPVTLSSTQQSKGLASPIILTPVGGSSPVGGSLGNGGSKGPWTDLNKFYEDEEYEDETGDEDEQDGNDQHTSEGGEEGGESETDDGTEDRDSGEEVEHRTEPSRSS